MAVPVGVSRSALAQCGCVPVCEGGEWRKERMGVSTVLNSVSAVC